MILNAAAELWQVRVLSRVAVPLRSVRPLFNEEA